MKERMSCIAPVDGPPQGDKSNEIGGGGSQCADDSLLTARTHPDSPEMKIQLNLDVVCRVSPELSASFGNH
jgi:hypothetical protein